MGGGCDQLPKTLTLVMTKISYFPYPIYDLFSVSVLRNVRWNANFVMRVL